MATSLLIQQELVTKYQQILQENGSTDIIIRVEVEPSKLTGEHMASVCNYVTLYLSNGKTKELFVKQLPTNPFHLAMLTSWNMFQKEAGFFNVILKDVKSYYMQRTGLAYVFGAKNPLDFFPTCYYADDKEIIMENLVKDKGYYLNSKLEKQDFETAKLVLKNMAQFHAVGYSMVQDIGGYVAMLQKYPILKESAFVPESQMLKTMIETPIGTALGILSAFKPVGGEAVIAKIQSKLGGVGIKEFTEEFSYASLETNIFNCINHGDSWNNNMLFLRDPKTNKLIHHVLVDFQLTRLNSPNNDLAYYLFTSVQNNIRQKYWKDLLQAYFEHLKIFVEKLETSFPFTFEQFLRDYLAKIAIGFWINITMSIGVEVFEQMDMTKLTGDPGEYFGMVLGKWLEENPDKAKQQAELIVELWDEYETLQSFIL